MSAYRELPHDFLDQLCAIGLRLFVNADSIDSPTYVFFTDGVRIGYAQADYFGGFPKFSTVHIPNSQTGTGFGDLTHDGTVIGGVNASFAIAPPWAKEADRQSVKKYANFDAWLKSQSILKYKEI